VTGEAEHGEGRTAGSSRPSAESAGAGTAAPGEAADDVRLVALDVIEILTAGFALKVILTVRAPTPRPFVVQVEPAKQALALAGCRDGHDDPQGMANLIAPQVTPGSR
jgi:hypothetical protein